MNKSKLAGDIGGILAALCIFALIASTAVGVIGVFYALFFMGAD